MKKQVIAVVLSMMMAVGSIGGACAPALAAETGMTAEEAIEEVSVPEEEELPIVEVTEEEGEQESLDEDNSEKTASESVSGQDNEEQSDEESVDQISDDEDAENEEDANEFEDSVEEDSDLGDTVEIADSEETVADIEVIEEVAGQEEKNKLMNDVSLPDAPNDGKEFWVFFREGYRNDRIEMSSFNLDSDTKDHATVLWNRNLTVKGSSIEGVCNQYYLNADNHWEQIGTYSLITDWATSIIASNLDIYDSSGQLVYDSTGNPINSNAIPNDRMEYNGHYYYVYETGQFSTFEEVESFCEQLGGHLATISSDEENQAIYKYIQEQGYKSAYFGFTDEVSEGTWRWVTGEEISYTNWHSGEPNGENTLEDYAMFYWKFTNGQWNDGSFIRGNDGYPFICEWDELSTEYNHFFILGEDTNQFIHYGLPYRFDDDNIKNKLYASTLLTWKSTFDLYKYLDGNTSGVCHGIALSMCYGNQGFIDFKSISASATNYWQLGDPRNNAAFKDVILYYHLSQLSYGGGATKRVDKGGWHIKSLEDRLKEFLSSLVEEAQKCSYSKKPFVFGFKENSDGHSVVVCGYVWNEKTRNHEIIIYDENSFNGQKGDYCKMLIPEDCQSFDFADANAVFGGYTIQDVWTSLEIYGIDSIYGSSNILKRTGISGANDKSKMTFQVSAGKTFRIEDDNGNWISYDGANYLGNMTVYDCYISGLDNDPYWNITVDSTQKLVLTDFEHGCELITQIDGKGYAVSSRGAKSIILQPDSVTAEGASYLLDVSVQSEKYDILQVQITAEGITTVKADNEVLTVSSTEECNDVKAWVHDQTTTEQCDTKTDKNGDVIIDFENNNEMPKEIIPTIILSSNSFVYNGKVQKPVITVKDSERVLSSSDYSITWLSDCKTVGTHQVKVTLRGSYSGTQTGYFYILPGKTTRGDMFNLANNVKVTWKEVPGAKYYKVYREGITDKKESREEPVIVTERLIGWDKEPGLTNGHAYRYRIVASLTGKGDSSGDSTLSYSKVMYRLKTVVIRSVKNTAPGKVTVRYDKTISGDSYVLQYCERQDMVGAKTKVVLGANNTSYTIGGLKKGKTYYISIRVRKKVNGIDYYTTFGVPKKINVEK